jgi:hypothetical protein
VVSVTDSYGRILDFLDHHIIIEAYLIFKKGTNHRKRVFLIKGTN